MYARPTLALLTADAICDARIRRTPGWFAFWCCLAYALVIAAWSAPAPSASDGVRQSEQSIKAAFLYKFLGYVDWRPGAFAQPTSPIVIAIIGAEDIVDALKVVAGERKVGRKDEFLAMLAHELRNPLAPLSNALEILKRTGSQTPVAQQARDMMDRQLRQMVRLVDDLLDVSRITTGKLAIKPQRCELSDVVRSAVDTARPRIEARRHSLTVTLPEQSVYVDADPTRLSQVFSNLLNNAANYTEPNGEVTLRATADDNRVTVSVKDNGIGIAPEMLGPVFQMFAQADESLERVHGGLGVGLTLARHVVVLHRGTIEARSDGIGHGSEFIVSLPRARVDAPADPTGSNASAQRTALT